MNRRHFLRNALLPFAGGVSLLGAGEARAQSDYRALVCVFLYGGNDGLNMLPPADAEAHGRYAAARGGVAIGRNDIVSLDGQVGLHPSLAPLVPIWGEGKLATLLNVGPLARPTTLAEYQAWRASSDASLMPEKLFSHADQQILWQNAHTTTSGLRGGWGGRLMEAIGGQQQVISFGGASRFGSGRLLQELALPGPGARLGVEGYFQGQQHGARRSALTTLFADGGSQVLAARYAELQREAVARGEALGTVLAQAPSGGGADPANPEIAAAFGNLSGATATPLARQLYQVAKLIKQRGVVGGGRHLFFVSQSSYDHHDNQLSQHAALLGELGTALAAFWSALKAIGAEDQVTLFTESDFGRTLKANASGGTDHGWGNLHLVMGGQVRGGRSYGRYPSLVFGGPDDAAASAGEAQGRWIPAVSVTQYAERLVDWFQPGLSTGNKAAVLPTLANFSGSAMELGFMAG